MKEKIDNNIPDFGEFEQKLSTEVSNDSINIDLGKLLKTLLANWKIILICSLGASLIGLVMGLSIPKTYTTTTVIAPELTTRGNAGGLTSLANLAGVNINSMAVTDAMHPDMYPAIVKSTDFVVSLFDMPVEVSTKDGIVQTDLYDYILNYCKSPWWTPILGLPHIAKDWVVSLFSKEDDDEDGAEGYATINPLRLTKEQEKVVKALGSSIKISVEKKTYILTIQATSQDKIIAAQLANKVVENLQRFVIDYRTERTRHNVEYYQKVVSEAKSEYLKAQHAYASYVDSHQGMARRSYEIESQRLQSEANLRYQLYNSMSQLLLQTEAKVQLESPVLVVIQKGLANRIGKPSKVKLMILWFILGAFCGIGYFIFFKNN